MLEAILLSLPKKYRELVEEVKERFSRGEPFFIFVNPPVIQIYNADKGEDIKEFRMDEFFPGGGKEYAKTS